MLVSSFNLSQSFNYTPYLFYKKRFKSEINSFCIWTPHTETVSVAGLRTAHFPTFSLPSEAALPFLF